MAVLLKGLTAADVAERERAKKVNVIPDRSSKSALGIVLSNIFTYFNAIFAVLTVLLIIVQSWKSLTFLPVVIANMVIGIYQQLKAKKVLDDLRLLATTDCTVIRDGAEQHIPVDQLVLDDLIVLEAGQQIPADAEVVQGKVNVNEALLTGESDEIEKERGAELMSGSFVVSGSCYARLTHVGADSYAAQLTAKAKPKKTIYASVDFIDIAGLVRGASKGEGLGNQFLANIRETDAILHVLRCFDDGNIVHVDGSVDPVRDKEVVDMELQIKDLETVENRIKKVEKQATTGGDKEAKKLLALLKRYQEVLLQGKSCRTVVPEKAAEEQMARDLYLLTNKPVMYVCNVDEASAVKGNAYVDAVRAAVADEHAEILVIAAKTESEIAEIEEYEDRQMFLEEMGLEESGVVRLIQGAYRLLGLQTFFTAGADECRAWTIRVGDKAPKAAGVIHTDFERGFIRAEVIKYEDFVHYKTEAAVRAAGKMGVEGKDYVVQDGDIMHFLFNV